MITADRIPYGASKPSDWQGDGQPGHVDHALDQLAGRLMHLHRANDGAGGQTVTLTAATLNLDTQAVNTDATVYSLASSQVTISLTSTYVAMLSMTFLATACGGCGVRAWLELNGVEVIGSRVYGYSPRGPASIMSLTLPAFPISVTAGQVLRARFVAHSGNARDWTTVADASFLAIARCFS